MISQFKYIKFDSGSSFTVIPLIVFKPIANNLAFELSVAICDKLFKPINPAAAKIPH